MRVFSKVISQSGLVDYITTRGDSYYKAYDLLKNLLIGTSNKTETVTLSNGEKYKIEAESIANNIYEDTSNLDIDNNSVKYWPTIDTNDYILSEYNKTSYGEFTQNLVAKDTYHSLIRLNTLKDEKYHHINIKTSNNKSIIFIVLDKSFKDGDNFEFKINFITPSNSSKIREVGFYPFVVFIDGSYANIKLHNKGEAIIVDNIKFKFKITEDIMTDVGPISLNEEVMAYNELNTTVYHNDGMLVSYNEVQPYLKNYDGISLNFIPYENTQYDNFGLYNDEYCSIYKNSEHVLICKNIDNGNDNNSYGKNMYGLSVVSKNNKLILSALFNNSYVVGLSDYNYVRNINNIKNYNYLSDYTPGRCDYLIDNLPNQFVIDKINTPFDSVDSSMLVKINLTRDITNIATTGIRVGLPGTKLSVFLKNTDLTTYFIGTEGITNTGKTVIIPTPNIDLIVGFKFTKNTIALNVALYSSNILYANLTTSYINVSDVTTYIPYTEYYISSINSNRTDLIINSYNIMYNMSYSEIDDYIKSFVYTYSNHSLSFYMSRNYITKVLPISQISGYLATIRPTFTSSVPMSDSSSPNVPNNNISYRLSFIYNKNKSNMYYYPMKKYIFNNLISKNIPVDTSVIVNNTKFTRKGIYINGESYYSTIAEQTRTSYDVLENIVNGISKAIKYNGCGQTLEAVYTPIYSNYVVAINNNNTDKNWFSNKQADVNIAIPPTVTQYSESNSGLYIPSVNYNCTLINDDNKIATLYNTTGNIQNYIYQGINNTLVSSNNKNGANFNASINMKVIFKTPIKYAQVYAHTTPQSKQYFDFAKGANLTEEQIYSNATIPFLYKEFISKIYNNEIYNSVINKGIITVSQYVLNSNNYNKILNTTTLDSKVSLDSNNFTNKLTNTGIIFQSYTGGTINNYYKVNLYYINNLILHIEFTDDDHYDVYIDGYKINPYNQDTFFLAYSYMDYLNNLSIFGYNSSEVVYNYPLTTYPGVVFYEPSIDSLKQDSTYTINDYESELYVSRYYQSGTSTSYKLVDYTNLNKTPVLNNNKLSVSIADNYINNSSIGDQKISITPNVYEILDPDESGSAIVGGTKYSHAYCIDFNSDLILNDTLSYYTSKSELTNYIVDSINLSDKFSLDLACTLTVTFKNPVKYVNWKSNDISKINPFMYDEIITNTYSADWKTALNNGLICNYYLAKQSSYISNLNTSKILSTKLSSNGYFNKISVSKIFSKVKNNSGLYNILNYLSYHNVQQSDGSYDTYIDGFSFKIEDLGINNAIGGINTMLWDVDFMNSFNKSSDKLYWGQVYFDFNSSLLKQDATITLNYHKSCLILYRNIDSVNSSTSSDNNTNNKEYKILGSEYINSYIDDPSNKENWKILGFYQLPINS